MPIRFLKFRFASAISLAAVLMSVSAQSGELATAFVEIEADTQWERVAELPLAFPTFHRQGMTRVGDRMFLSSVEVIDRANEKGMGHLFEFDLQGNLVHDLHLAEGPVYHPGGIDFDGESIWLSLAEYRPDSTSIVYRINPDTYEAIHVFRFNDHLGAVAHLPEQQLLIGVNWGSRRFYEWTTERTDSGWQPVDPEHPRATDNPSHYVAYQDLQTIPGTNYLLASGVRKMRAPSRDVPMLQFGGVDLLVFPGAAMRHGLPLNLATQSRIPMTQNPFYVEMKEGRIEFRFIPEDNESKLYVYAPN